MQNEMVENAATRLYNDMRPEYPLPFDACERAVRSVIAAMREPTEAMVLAGEKAAWDDANNMPAFRAIETAYSAAIDAALLP